MTEWFVKEINNHLKVWGRFKGGGPYHRAIVFKTYAKLIPYKWMPFPSKACNVTDDCKDTVTLQRKCIHKSELGNVILGIIGQKLLPTGAVIGGALLQGENGPDTLNDAAGIIAGFVLYPMARDGKITAEELKKALTNEDEIYYDWWRDEGFKHAQLEGASRIELSSKNK